MYFSTVFLPSATIFRYGFAGKTLKLHFHHKLNLENSSEILRICRVMISLLYAAYIVYKYLSYIHFMFIRIESISTYQRSIYGYFPTFEVSNPRKIWTACNGHYLPQLQIADTNKRFLQRFKLFQNYKRIYFSNNRRVFRNTKRKRWLSRRGRKGPHK